MTKAQFRNICPYLVKIVHVKLSDEGGQIIVLEISWEDRTRKQYTLVNLKSCSIINPMDTEGSILARLQQIPQFLHES